MFAGFFRELKAQILTFVRIVRTREFWIYVAVIMVMVVIVAAVIRLAFGFDPLTRGRLGIPFSCRTGEGQLATIIVGAFAFGIACAFTLGEVVKLGRGNAPGARAGTALQDRLLAAGSARAGNGRPRRRRLPVDADVVHVSCAGRTMIRG